MPVIGYLSGSTCGDSCWHAREDVCHCSCGGVNHGCLRSADGVQPTRTAKIDGHMCELAAVGYDIDKDAIAINKAAGVTSYNAHRARQHWGTGQPKAMVRGATEAQVKKWPELAAYRHNLKEAWREANPTLYAIHWPGLPDLLWVIKE